MKQLRIFVKPLVAKFAEVERKKAESPRFDSSKSLWPSMEQFILSQVQIKATNRRDDEFMGKYSEILLIDVPDEFYLKHKDVSSFTLKQINAFIENIFDSLYLTYIHSKVDYYKIFEKLPRNIIEYYGLTNRKYAINVIRDFRELYNITEEDILIDTMYRRFKRTLASETFKNKKVRRVKG